MSEHEQSGPTGQYPRGVISIRVGHDDDRHVALNFCAPVVWFVMSATVARLLAADLIASADQSEATLRRN